MQNASSTGLFLVSHLTSWPEVCHVTLLEPLEEVKKFFPVFFLGPALSEPAPDFVCEVTLFLLQGREGWVRDMLETYEVHKPY